MNSDEIYIDRCIEIAQKGKFHVAPNPMVGCLFVSNDVIVSEGYHKKFGSSHAEVNAYNSLPSDINPKTCDVYVSLEPCSFHGKTPPCSDLLIKIKPNRVVIGCLDPNSKVSGAGVEALEDAGINVIVGVLKERCEQLNKHFFKAQRFNLPFVTLKWAQTQNKFMAREPNCKESSKISDLRNDSYIHDLRAKHQAILVGANTVNIDDPLLNVRYSEGNDPLKVVLSPNLSVDFKKQLFSSGQTLIYNKISNELFDNCQLKKIDPCNIEGILSDLIKQGINSILVEGGIKIIQSFLDSDLWDEAIIIESNNSWDDGLIAPLLNSIPVSVKQAYNDSITTYNNKI
ncbi:MAG: bifunctional diaminohydroxyphosphoribosylaminopyrimidine deaminase/5-amino-6-(5-phosphoribosylamino)uracil reductase RibD [Bacteroidia bacterium]|nr:bifunctional diaminohydroxyphosphoribosylaminopyrimidine deaminase/5-amino-6-(5-phosphoribosylamino)uracil reductase RibD [Bacteroidia bacterium]